MNSSRKRRAIIAVSCDIISAGRLPRSLSGKVAHRMKWNASERRPKSFGIFSSHSFSFGWVSDRACCRLLKFCNAWSSESASGANRKYPVSASAITKAKRETVMSSSLSGYSSSPSFIRLRVTGRKRCKRPSVARPAANRRLDGSRNTDRGC